MPSVQYLTPDEIITFLEAAKASGPRDFALLLAAYELGARATEVASLRRRELDLTRGTCVVRALKWYKAKKGKPAPPPPRFVCSISKPLVAALRAYLETAPDSPWVFPSKRDPKEHVTRFDVSYAYTKAARKLDLGPGRTRHVHLLRHSKAMHKAATLAEKGMGAGDTIKTLQDTLRQKTEGMALKYVHMNSEAHKISQEVDEEMTEAILRRMK